MKYWMTLLLFAVVSIGAAAQESHYHKALRGDQSDNMVGFSERYIGSGVYWSRVRDPNDTEIVRESREDSLARNQEFRKLCQMAYDAYDDGDYYYTAIYGDSALSKKFHTPELYYFMAMSLEKLECYKDADAAYKKAIQAGYMKAVQPYAAFQKRMNELKTLDKVRKKEAKRTGQKFVSLSEGKDKPEPMEVKREPRLQLISTTLRIDGLTDDGYITPGRKCKLYFQLRNNGNAPTGLCDIMLGDKSGSDALNIGTIKPLVINPREICFVEIPIEADETLEEGEIDLIVMIDEPNGYGLPPRHVKLKARK